MTEPVATPAASDPTGWRRLRAHLTDLGGGLQVRRLLPAAAQRAVGPFVFFDHFGPVTLAPGADSDVRPHPHIGLATLTWLYEGCLLHRDSLGSEQEIRPGDVNWMSAGRGIVHSERTPAALRGQPRPLHGLQLWIALPAALEQGEPHFQHVAAAQIPLVQAGSARVQVVVGTAFGATSPVRTAAPTLCLSVRLAAGQPWQLPRLAAEQALYSPSRTITLDGAPLGPGELAVIDQADHVTLLAAEATDVAVIGGAPLDGPRLLWWNFVATERALIDAAAERWAADGFEPVPGETERIPLPARR